MRRLPALVLLALVGWGGLASAATGNPAGVRLDQREYRAFTHVHTIDFTETNALLGARGDSWMWTAGSRLPGDARAHLRGVIELRDDRVAFTEVQISSSQRSLVVTSSRRGVVRWSRGTLADPGCTRSGSEPAYLTTGSTYENTRGHVDRPRRRGDRVLLTATAALGGGFTVTQAAALNPATDLPSSATTRISRADTPTIVYTQTLTYRAAVPAPRLRACS